MSATPVAFCPPAVALDRPGIVAQPVPAGTVAPAFLPAAARRWFVLAVGSLVVAGLLSISVVIGRIPGVARFIDDPLFFKRCLVVHVDLALVVWFYAFIAGLNALVAGRRRAFVGTAGFVVAFAGVATMMAGALMRGAQPVLANYVPVIDHPLFLGGLGAFFVGTLFFLIDALGAMPRAFPGAPAADSAIGLQASAVAFVLAGATWLATRASLPAGLDAWTSFEFSAWGAGHVLQVANAAAMVAVWLWLLGRATGRPVLGPRGALLAFGALVAPHCVMPLLTAKGALDTLYHTGATQLMRWGIFPVVTVVLVISIRHLRRHGLAADEPLARLARTGFIASASLTSLGFILGACIRSSTTLVPAHYHASLGGVTVAFMTAAYLVCAGAARSGLAAKTIASARRQVGVFGVGQTVFALGFGLGGLYGLGRKTYAGEQHVRSAGEYVGLGIMGVGGLVATVAGVWFLWLVLREMRGWWSARAAASVSPNQSSS